MLAGLFASPMIMLGVGLFVLVAVGGMNACSYQKGKNSRDAEVAKITLAKDSAEAANASLAREVDKKNEIITRQNTEVERLGKIGASVRSLQSTIRADAEARAVANQVRLAGLESAAKSGTEPGISCPKTYGILGDLADSVRDGSTAPVAASPAPVVPAPKPTTVAAPKPVLPPKPLPPAIRVKP